MTSNIKPEEIYSRNELCWGKNAQKSLWEKHVIVFGLGGVGGFAAEALTRSGIGKLTIIDFDKISESNLNRQLIATIPDIGRFKTDVMKERIYSINPHIEVIAIKDFYTPKLNDRLFSQKIDFVVDAIDSLRQKVELIETCVKSRIRIISSMGAGNRLNPEKLFISEFSEIKKNKCSFIKNVAYRLKMRDITGGFMVCTSNEKPQTHEIIENTQSITTAEGEKIDLRKFTPASVPFVPPVAGYMMAGYVVREFISGVDNEK